MASMTGTVNALLESVGRRGNIPVSQSTYLTTDLLTIANEELMAFALPILHARREDYYLEELEFDMATPDALIAGRHPAFRLPEWAMASTVRDVQAVSAGGAFYNLGRLMVDDVPNSMSQGWYFYGNYIVYQNNVVASTAPPVALRCIVHVKPSMMWVYDQDFPDSTTEATGVLRPVRVDYTVENPPTSETFVVTLPDFTGSLVDGGGRVNIVSGFPGYEVKMRNLSVLESAIPQHSLVIPYINGLPQQPAPVKGDWLTGSAYTPVVPLPLEMHALLAQRIVVKFLEAQGDAGQLQQARDSLQEMVMQVPLLIQPRAEGKPKKLANRVGLWRRWRW